MTNIPSTPVVLTLATWAPLPAYGLTLVMVFWCTVKSFVSVKDEECPRVSASRNVAKAPVLSRPTGLPAFRALSDLDPLESSKLPTACQSPSIPEKTKG